MKKWILRILLALLVIFLIGGIWAYTTINGQRIDYNESLNIDGLTAEVEIYYDDYAIPHIYAESNEDAYRALGYLHARDRLWQIDLVRRIAPGRLSELFGEATLDSDKFFRTIGLAHQSKKEAKAFLERESGELKTQVLAYIDGVNEFIDRSGGAIEHKLMGLDVEPYTLEDVYNVLGYMSFSFSVAHKTEPTADYIMRALGTDYTEVLDWDVNLENEIIPSDAQLELVNDLSHNVLKVLDQIPVPELIGSNSWVVSGDMTADGNVLFANDPHIGYSQPCVWYEAHITTPDTENYGYYLAGNPMAQVGHNRHHAVGLTMFENDDIDYYRLKLDGGDQYEYNGEWRPLTVRNEEILVKDSKEPVKLTVRESHFGPIISDVVANIDSTDALSMWWVYQQLPLRGLEATYQILNAKSVEEVQKGVELIHAPGLNVMYGDVEGNIAWWAAAQLPIRPEHVDPRVVLDGTSDEDEILGYYDFSKNPQVINPKKGYVYSANNQSENAEGMRPPGYYLPEDRARRIVHLLEQKDDWKSEDFKKMIVDVQSNNAPEIVATLLPLLKDADHADMLNTLASWDGSYGKDDVAPTIYTKLIHNILKSAMTDELGDRWEVFKTSHLYRRSIPMIIASADTPWWDDVNTNEKEGRKTIITNAWNQSIKELTEQLGDDYTAWRWGGVHRVTHKHTFDADPTLRDYFNVGSFDLPGTNEVINNYLFPVTDDGKYEVVAGPSTRRIMNMGKLDSDSWSILPTGQSGNVLSPHYSDQAEMYATGQFRRQLMNKEDITTNYKYHQTFSPKK